MQFLIAGLLFFAAGFFLGKMTRYFDLQKQESMDLAYTGAAGPSSLELRAFISEIYDQSSRVTTPSRFCVSVTNLSKTSVELLGWFMRFKNSQTNTSRKIEFRPQNLTSTLPAGERFTIELSDLEVFRGRELEGIIVRALPGGEFQLSDTEVSAIKAELDDLLEEKD